MKFIQPAVITAEYKLSTPMFLGDAFQEADATVMRNASFKGALRFWWRALNWGRILASQSGDQAAALKALHQREGELFGRASDSKSSAQSLVQISSKLEGSQLVAPGAQPQNLVYLLGQGLYSHSDRGPAGKKGTQRPYLSGGRLTVEARLKPGATQEDTASLEQALAALGLLGGLGSRARKGFGSLSLQHLAHSGQVHEFNDLAAIQRFLSTLDFSAPLEAPLSAFTSATHIDVSATGPEPWGLLEAISKEQQLFRSYGKDGMVGREEARRNFVEDHDNVREAIHGKPLQALPKRAVFGLPHNYHYSSGGDMNIAPAGNGRRASPLFIHIHQFPKNDGCAAIQTLMPSVFLPAAIAIEASIPKGRGKAQLIRNPSVDYQVIHRYLDGFKQRKVLRDAR